MLEIKYGMAAYCIDGILNPEIETADDFFRTQKELQI